MSILVTGGTGFIGSHVVVELLNLDYEVIIIDNLSNSYSNVIDNIVKITGKTPVFYQVDVNDICLNDIFKKHIIDTVIHLAGHKSISESIKNPLKYFHNNVNGLINVLQCMNRNNIKKIIFSSSATVYGNPLKLPINEESDINILNPYAQSKRMSELILEDIKTELSIISLRYFNPVGGHESGLLNENTLGLANNLFPVIMNVYQGKQEYLEVFGTDYATKDGTCIRDYIHVVDLAKGHIKALNYIKPGYEAFNLGTGIGYSVFDIINEFEKYGKLNYKIKNKRIGDASVIYSDCQKANHLLKWQSTYNLQDMVKSCILK